MKKIMPFFVAGALLMGSACNTYTASTDVDDKGTGYALTGQETEAGQNNSAAVAESNSKAMLANPDTQSPKDSTGTDSAAVAKDTTAASAKKDTAAKK
ncbi:hypothetical protein GU926_13805 [Nibribacter ruber]|uniref:Entericidin n=1 Tax=Nibribacter ruber TaxID=2698458 RepID=A0A6P1P231_9BACT|nr:hypothetical protein [Nibribacter ruber]QHL88449.1 hypothetical protein GU926_13805 [Nibribacter ruber]